MRWKLLLISSLVAAIAGACACLWIARSLGFDYQASAVAAPPLSVVAVLLVPLATITFAAIFVYRHTARRRLMQAMMTVLCAALLTLAAVAAGLMFLLNPADGEPRPAPTPQIKTVG